jgi:Spondin_N
MMMKSVVFFYAALTFAVLTICACSSDLRGGEHRQEMDVQFTPTGTANSTKLWNVKVTNMSYKQSFGHIFVMAHNNNATGLFAIGRASTAAFAYLAELGNPSLLVSEYTDTVGVQSATMIRSEPIFAGKSVAFTVETSREYPLISFATMMVNTNDGFAGLSKIKPYDGLIQFSPGYDAGTETNDELCIHIPGPACVSVNRTNSDANDAGEGFVHIHRGIHGHGDIDASTYDWRNPIMQLQINRMY